MGDVLRYYNRDMEKVPYKLGSAKAKQRTQRGQAPGLILKKLTSSKGY